MRETVTISAWQKKEVSNCVATIKYYQMCVGISLSAAAVVEYEDKRVACLCCLTLSFV